MIGFRPGNSLLHRAHPYTPLAIAATMLCLVFAADTVTQIAWLLAAAIALAIVGRSLLYVTKPMLALAVTTWILLFVLHGMLGPAPYTHVLGIRVSAEGFQRAVVLGGRIAAVLIAFLAALATVSPARLVEAMTEREVSFRTTYLLVSTLTLVPRMRRRAAQILEAQQCRGLRLGGSPVARVAALGPLVMPLVLGALSEVDEQVLALDTRGVSSGRRRTALAPPPDSGLEWAIRVFCFTVVLGTWLAKITPLFRALGLHPVEIDF